MTDPIVIYQPTERTRTQVQASNYKGKTLADIRLWYLTQEGTWAPSQKGVALPLEVIPALIDALSSVLQGAL